MINSPDQFYTTRFNHASLKASQAPLQSMEFKAHNKSINEYSNDMLAHLIGIQAKTLPNLSLIQQQPEINLKMRPLLLDFLMDVINKLQLSKSTFPLCVNLIDRYCSTRIVKKQHYQLLGLTSLWISCKNSDSKIKIPTLNDLCKMCCNCYDKKLFLEMENHLLKSLNWLISFPTFDSFIDIFCKEYAAAEFFNGSTYSLKQVKYLAIYICELIQFYPNIYFNYNSCEISITAFLLSLLILNFKIQPVTEIARLNKLAAASAAVDENSERGRKRRVDNENDMDLEDQQEQQQPLNNGEMITSKTFHGILQALLKVLKCPPPSLKLKYFSKSNKNLNLMQLLIKFCNLNLTPVSSNPITPKNSIHKLNQLPPTPLSSNISPNGNSSDSHNISHYHNYNSHINSHHNGLNINTTSSATNVSPFLPSPRLSPHNTTHYFNTSPPFTPLDIRAGSVFPSTGTSATSNVRSSNSEYTTSNLNTVTQRVGSSVSGPDSSSMTTTVTTTTAATTSIIQNATFVTSPPYLSSAHRATSSSTSSVPTLKKRSFQILNIESSQPNSMSSSTHGLNNNIQSLNNEINEDENLKRSKSSKPIFFIS